MADSPAWHVFTPDYDYDKTHYLVRVDGAIVGLAWPNAGLMCLLDGSGRRVEPAANVEVQRRELVEMRALRAVLTFFGRLTGAHDEAKRVKLEEDRKSLSRARAALGLAASLGGVSLAPPKPRECTHGFGLAGGFSECSACGIKRRRP